MSRRLLSPRGLGLLALLAVVVAACTLLGLWQLGVAHDEGRRESIAAAASLPRRPLSEVTAPHSPFAAELSNRAVTVTGTYAAKGQFVVVGRRLGTHEGSWVVTPLVTDTGGTVAVLRGFVDGAPATAPTPPTGRVEVAGTLGPSESPRGGADSLPPGQRRSLDLASLVNEWPGELYNVVVLASAESSLVPTGVASVSAGALTRVPPPDPGQSLNLRNAAYAVQWWVFGIFAIWMWWKMMRVQPPTRSEPLVPKEEAHA
ncbi:MAG TPA: SURF1 family protein [Intrasporangium sp.]|uniref:SURF1 family protein n=1 Tax=Intrasporangium sp. TaxID=1925024 RepID=UPI002D79590D|nr:SURF1 family protein [Intrasporangium sp.]HET7397674.1 SURF1 family protein [Intrasporangium sp.]